MPELTRGGGHCAVCGDPIDRRATFCRRHAKAPDTDPQAMAEIEMLAEDYRALQAQLESSRGRLYAALREAKKAGHSFNQLREASGFAVGSLQKIVE